MEFAKKTSMVVGVMALAVLIVAVLAPNTAHGLVAALVQVVNTPTTAIPAVQAPAASTLYQYNCEAGFTTNGANCAFPDLGGKTLIIESFSILVSDLQGATPRETRLYGSTSPSTVLNIAYIPLAEQTPATCGVTGPGTGCFYVGVLQGRVSTTITPVCELLTDTNPTHGGIACTISGYLISGN